MTHFLWVEDFNISETKRSENIVSSTVSSVFGSILDNKELSERLAEEDENDAQDFLEEKGIFLKLNLLEALEFINDPKELSKIDFVVLDVDMPLENGQRDNNNYLPILIEQYKSEDALRKIAGYQIYTELVIELGFPKSHILFCSNHASYFEELKSKFASANIKPPISPNPNEPFLRKEDKEFINQWLDAAHLDYFVLRRGIIEACNYLENKTSDAELQEYFFGLKRYLPLKEPNPTEKESIYLHLVRAIVHDWDDKGHPIPDRRVNPIGNTLGWLLRTARNWLAHDSLLNNFDEKTIAFIFLINVRLLANLEDDKLEPFELKLLSLFDKNTLSQAEINKLKTFYKEAIEVCQNNNLNFINKYYNQLVNDFHENSIVNCDYTKLLFRVFMFAIYQQNPSFPRTTNTANPNSPFLDYQVRFVKRNNLPCYLEEFEKCFYPLAV
ncbi:MAG: hypothetical protein WCK96_12810 [Methylococcales bacterium]